MTAGQKDLPARLSQHPVREGRPWPLGATFDGEGVNFAVFSANAEAIELCLFSEDGRKELARLPLRDRDGDVWHINVAGLTPGTRYGYRAHGPYKPEEGHRFNPNKLLIDPYAKQLHGRLRWSDAVMGYRVGGGKGGSELRQPRQRLCGAEIGGGRSELPLGARCLARSSAG